MGRRTAGVRRVRTRHAVLASALVALAGAGSAGTAVAQEPSAGDRRSVPTRPVASVAPDQALGLTVVRRPAGGRPVVVRVGKAELRLVLPRRSTGFDVAGGGRRVPGKRDGRTRLLVVRQGGRIRVEDVRGRLVQTRDRGGPVRVEVGGARVADPLKTSIDDVAGRIAQRSAVLWEALAPNRRFQGTSDTHVVHTGKGWMSAFLPGALWRSARSLRSNVLARLAAKATDELDLAELRDDHDVGFVASEGPGLGLLMACGPAPAVGGATVERCAKWRGQVLAAARQIEQMMGASPAGVLPTRVNKLCKTCLPENIEVLVDSSLNLVALDQAAQLEQPERWLGAARRHAAWIVREHPRPNGSVWQAVELSRATGRPGIRETYQGNGPTGEWGRGQGWFVHGMARRIVAGETELLQPALAGANRALQAVPADGVTRYDMNAPASAPTDTSALTLFALGWRDLSAVCRSTGACDAAPYELGLARAKGTLARFISDDARDPFGRFDGQCFTVGGRASWDEETEMSFGLAYAAELYKR